MNTNTTPVAQTTTNSGTTVGVGMPTTGTMNNSGNALVQNVAAIKNGEVPQNAQIQNTLQQTRQALDEAKYEGNLSSKGQILVDDAKAVLDSASRLVEEKNHDQKLQRLVGNTVGAASETRTNLSGTTGSVPVGRGDLQFAQGEAREIYNAAREVVVFAVRSGQFREILMELMDLLQSILRSTQEKIATQPDLTQPQDIANQMKNETFFTQEQQNSLFAKFKAIAMRMGSHPEYYNAVDHLFTIVDQMEEKATLMKSQAQSSANTAVLPTGRYEQIWYDAKSLLEEFSGNGSVDMFVSRVSTLQFALRDDAEARAILWEARQYLREVIRQPTLLDQQAKADQGKQLFNRTRFLLQGKHKQSFQDVFDAARLILNNISNDSSSQDFAQKVAKFVSDFAYDADGKPDLFVLQQSLGQMKSIIVPVLTKQLANLPIPRIEGSNPKYDFAIEGLLLNITDLLPDFINIRTKTDSRVNVQKLNAQKNSAKIVMEVDQVKAFFRDVKFMYRRKKMPRIEDNGVADVDISQGTGISLKMVWKVKSVGGQPLQLKLVRVKCNIARLVITVKQAKHKIVDKLVTKLFANTIKRQMANAIVNNIIKSVQPLGARLNDLLKRRPTLAGGMGRVNEGMKSTLFSGTTGEQTTLMKAKDQINTAVTQVKDKVQDMKAQHNTSTTTTTTEVVLPQYTVEKHTTAFVEPITYVEKDRTVARKDWAFEWYNTSSAYDSSIERNGNIIPVQQEDDYVSVPVDQMATMNLSNNNKISV